MPINKFTTLLDLARQAKILTGETATFDGKIQVGIPFSGYPTGVDTGTTVSLGIVSSQSAVFSGDTGTTVFDTSNPSSPYYDPSFDSFSAFTWSNPLFSAYTSGLTLPITILSADTQIVGPFWTLTQTGNTGDYIIGTEYTGYSITYSFFNVISLNTGTTLFSGFTTASQENFSAGTLDYKGPLDYLSSKEDASIDGRLTTNKITITNGASLGTIGYVLTQTGQNGEGEWLPNSSADTNTYVTGGTLSGTNLVLEWNTGGSASPIELSGLSSNGTFTGITITNITTGDSVSILGITSGGTIVDGSDMYDEICDYCSSTVSGDTIIGSGVTETDSINTSEATIDSTSPYSCTQWCYYKSGEYVGTTTDYDTALKYQLSGYVLRCCDGNSSDGGTNYGPSISAETTSSGNTIPVVITGLTRPFSVKNTKKISLSNSYKSDVLNSNQVSISDSTLSRIDLSTLSFIESSFNSKIYGSYLSGIISSENGFISNSGNGNIIGSQYSILSGTTGSTIIGGNNITGTTNDTVYVPNLNLGNFITNPYNSGTLQFDYLNLDAILLSTTNDISQSFLYLDPLGGGIKTTGQTEISTTNNSIIISENNGQIDYEASIKHRFFASANTTIVNIDSGVTITSNGNFDVGVSGRVILGVVGTEFQIIDNRTSDVGITSVSDLSPFFLSTQNSFIKQQSYRGGIIGGNGNTILSGNSNPIIVGGAGNIINANLYNTVIIGGSNITATTNNTVYVPNLNIGIIGSGSSVFNLGLDSSGNVVTGTTGGSDIYTTDGTLTGNRTVTQGSFDIYFIGNENSRFNTYYSSTTNPSDYGSFNNDWNSTDIAHYDDTNGISFSSNFAAGNSALNVSDINTLESAGVGFSLSSSFLNHYDGISTSRTVAVDISGVSINSEYYFPNIDGSNGQVLTTDGSGNVSWQTSSGGVSIDPYNNVGNVNTITWDVSGTSTNYQATLTGNTTLNLTNVRNGDYGTIILTQDGTGGRTITFGTVNGSATTHRVANGGGGSAVLTSNGNAIDILTFTYNGSVMFWTVGNDYT